MDYAQFWEAVLGRRTAQVVVQEFDLVGPADALNGWLGEAELAACMECRPGEERIRLEQACDRYRGQVLEDLAEAVAEAVAGAVADEAE